MRILYLHQYFATPEGSWGTRSFEFAKRLVAAGHAVTVITSQAALELEDQHGISRFQVEGIDVVALDVAYKQSMSVFRRKLSFGEFAVRSLFAARAVPADIVFATSTPLTIAIPGVVSARMKRVPLVLEIRDLWPTVPISMGALRSPIAKKAALWLEAWAYRSARHIVALSPGIRDGILSRGVDEEKISTIPNSCDLELFARPPSVRDDARKSLGVTTDDVLVLYAGSFGKVNSVDYLVRMAAVMRTIDRRLCFLLVGSGSEFESVIRLAGQLGVLDGNLRIRDAVPKKDLVDFFAAADVVTSVVAPIDELHHNSANKFFDGLAAGRPVAINHEGWQADVLRETRAGFVLDPDPSKGAHQLAQNTSDRSELEACGMRALDLARSRFSRDEHAVQLEEILLDQYHVSRQRTRSRESEGS